MIFVKVTGVRGDIVIEPDYTCYSGNLRNLCSISAERLNRSPAKPVRSRLIERPEC
jgi:hypothetical protein